MQGDSRAFLIAALLLGGCGSSNPAGDASTQDRVTTDTLEVSLDTPDADAVADVADTGVTAPDVAVHDVTDVATDLPTDARVDVDWDAGACADCVSATVRWRVEGGYDAGYVVEHEVRACRTFAMSTVRFGGGVTEDCAGSLTDCAASDGVAALQRALAHPDVVSALREERPFFGANNTGVDMGYLRIRVGDRELNVGGECLGDCRPGHRAIPQGVADLAATLLRVTSSARARCVPSDAGA